MIIVNICVNQDFHDISDSGISADESALSSDDTRYPLPDIVENSDQTKPGQLKPPPRRTPWH